MPILSNHTHERFCQELHTRLAKGDGAKQRDCRVEAYEAVGFETKKKHVADNARKLANKPEIKARLAELIANSALLAEIDRGWSMRVFKKIADAPLESVELGKVSPADRIAATRAINEMCGFNAPVKVANTDTEGNDFPISDADRVAAFKLFMLKTNPNQENSNG
jgi:hypothetical protein